MPPTPVTLTFDLESGIQVTCDVGYLCANFSLPRPLCSRLRPPRAGSGIARIDPLRFLAGCRTRRLNQV